MASSTWTLLALAAASLMATTADAKAFLKVSPVVMQETMSEEDVQTSLLAEIEGTFGEGSASSRVQLLEAQLRPIYAALPKNEKGYLAHSTVRYALHRLFVQRHGWIIKGLDAAGGHRNSTAGAHLLKEQVPAYIQDLFEKRLGDRGFGLHELGVLAATIEHLVHSEAIKRLGHAFKVHHLLPTSVISADEADDVLDTYMTLYILGDNMSKIDVSEVHDLKAEMPEVYMSWNETQQFVREMRKNVTELESSAEQKTSGNLDFSLIARTAERVGEHFGSFQNQECKQIKADLLKMEEPGTGRVRLSDFYKPALEGRWQFQESIAYLRQLGALDETDPKVPRVIIANYISSPSNCIASSSFYSVCCIDECENLLGQLESKLAAPEASTTSIANLVTTLSSSSVQGPRKLSDKLLSRLGEIAAEHGGSVPLHGRLFAQWMHHAFPGECPYPHLSGTTNPQTPDEWLESTGLETTATKEDMQIHVSNDSAETTEIKDGESDEERDLPWLHQEELLVERPQLKSKPASSSWLRTAVFVIALVAFGYAAADSLTKAKSASALIGGKTSEKYLV